MKDVSGVKWTGHAVPETNILLLGSVPAYAAQTAAGEAEPQGLHTPETFSNTPANTPDVPEEVPCEGPE